MDQGRQSFRYAIYPHNGSWEEANVVQRAAEFNQPPFVLLGTTHPEGNLPQVNSFVSIDANNIVVSVLKEAEDNPGLILRCYEVAGKAGQAAIQLPICNRNIVVEYHPYEIKTMYIPYDTSAVVREVNLIES
jgi:alpha-mannosidase